VWYSVVLCRIVWFSVAYIVWYSLVMCGIVWYSVFIESILNSIFWFRNPQKTYILLPRVGHLRQYKSPRMGILLHYLDPMVGHLQRFFAKMTNARQTPGGRATHAWNLFRHKDAVQSDMRMCTKDRALFLLYKQFISVFILFYVLAKLDCCVLIIYHTLES
jgi:hypothetical protein